MHQQTYKYRFEPQVPAREFEETFCLALLATESLHGPSLVRMDCKFKVDKENRTITVDATTRTGEDLAKIFTGLCEREFGVALVSIDREGGGCACAARSATTSPAQGVAA